MKHSRYWQHRKQRTGDRGENRHRYFLHPLTARLGLEKILGEGCISLKIKRRRLHLLGHVVQSALKIYHFRALRAIIINQWPTQDMEEINGSSENDVDRGQFKLRSKAPQYWSKHFICLYEYVLIRVILYISRKALCFESPALEIMLRCSKFQQALPFPLQ